MSTRALLAFAVLTLLSCGPTAARCDSTNCLGCCDASGQCQGGGALAACGALGGLCSACVGAQTCALGRCQAPACTSASCSSLGLDCGQAEDGCGGVLECGSCSGGKACGAGGRANVCAMGSCAPSSCATLSAECGRVSDGCAALLSCGTCSAGSSCGLNAPNRCGCRPTTCSALSRDCGDVSDGCTGMLSCGTCSGGRTCGGGGTPGVCGTGSCTPTTCAALGKDCGMVSDGCGTMLACGSCSAALSCGGAGTPNVCGATCGNGCPSGFSCNAQGVCTGSSSSLVLNVLTVPVSGSVRLNGATPTRSGSCVSSTTETSSFVTFTNQATGTSLRADVLCSSSNFDYSLAVPPGTYQVTVYGFQGANLPRGAAGVNSALVVSGPTTGLTLNVPTVPVSGSVRLNGAIPTRTGSCVSSTTETSGFVTFTNVASGTSLRVDVLCSSANFDYSLAVPPGTYQVTVYGFAGSNLPRGAAGVNPAVVVSGPTTGLTLNVPTVQVSGSVRLNGATPTRTGSCVSSTTETSSFVTFTNFASGTSLRVDVLCSSVNFDYSLPLPPGTYQVTVYGFAGSNLPRGAAGVNPALVVSGPTTGLTLNVPTVQMSGSVRLNGAIPTRSGSCVSSTTETSGFVTFTNVASGTSLRVDLLCSSANFDYSLAVPPGTYQVTVYGFQGANLPRGAAGVNPALVVSGPTTGLTLNVRTVQVSGSVRLNGMVPTRTGSCVSSTTETSSFVTFTEETAGTSLRVDVLCSSANFDFSLPLPPGTYEVTVYGFQGANLPRGAAGVVSQLQLN